MSDDSEFKRPTHQLREIFCSELPSRFCRSHIGNIKSAVDSPSTIRLATELHRVSLSKRDVSDKDDYMISTKSLPYKTRTRSKSKSKQSSERDGDDDCICISHSFLSFDKSVGDSLDAIEVFAVSRESRPSNAAATSDTIPSHAKSKSETSICAISISESVIKEDAGSAFHDDSKSISFELHITCRVRDSIEDSAKTTRQKSTNETIPLNFRPSIVHVSELNMSTNNKEPNTRVIGIYVTSSDDSKLRLYVATRQSLEICGGEYNPVKPPCFNLTTLSFDIINLDDNDSTNDRSGDPFTFRCPITALDSYHNKLAVGLFNGTVRIMSCQFKYTESLESITCQMLLSTYILDGPVATIHFGSVYLSRIYVDTNQDPTSNSFLVAGSLCGFACLFYEVQPVGLDQQGGTFSYFGGPLALVDELYDPIYENEDCVTAVHGCCSYDSKPKIAVGTQRGRVLLFQTTVDPKYAFNESQFLDRATSELDDLVCRVTGANEEIDALRSETEDLRNKSKRINDSIAELRTELEVLEINSIPIDGEENQSDDYIGDIQVEPFLLRSKIQLLEVEMSKTREVIDTNETKLIDLKALLTVLKNKQNSSKADTMAQLYSSVRKMYRYEIICQYQLPYPIHAMYFHDEELLVFTRRTVHVFQKTLSNTASIEDTLALFEKRLAGILQMKDS